MAGGGAHRLGIHELDRGHPAQLVRDLQDAGVEQRALLGRHGQGQPRQRRPPQPREHQAGVGQVGVVRLDGGAGLGQDARGLLHRRDAVRIHRGVEAGAGHDGDRQPFHPVLDPVAPVARIVGQAERVTSIEARHGGEHQRGIPHRPRHRPGAGDGGKRAGRPLRDAPVAGLQPHQPAPRGRNAHRPPSIGADMQRPEPGRPRRARARGGASGRVVPVPGVAGDAVQRIVAGGFPAELGRGGLAQNHSPRRFQADHHGGVVLHGGGVGGAAAAARRKTGDIHQIFDRGGYPVQRPHRAAGAPTRGAVAGLAGGLGVHAGEGVDVGVEPCDPLGDRLQHVHRRQAPAGKGFEHGLGGEQGWIVGHAGFPWRVIRGQNTALTMGGNPAHDNTPRRRTLAMARSHVAPDRGTGEGRAIPGPQVLAERGAMRRDDQLRRRPRNQPPARRR